MSRTTVAIAMVIIIAIIPATKYISRSVVVATPIVVVVAIGVVDAETAFTIIPVAADELPYESSPLNDAVIV